MSQYLIDPKPACQLENQYLKDVLFITDDSGVFHAAEWGKDHEANLC